MGMHNEGIVVSGGQFSAVQATAGRGARATINGDVAQLRDDGRDEVADALQQLLVELERAAPRLDDADELIDTAQAVGAELSKKAPNKRTLGALLTSIGAGAGSVTSVVTAVKALAGVAGIALGSLTLGG